VLQKLAAMRSYMRGVTLGTASGSGGGDAQLAHAVGMTPEAMEQMYRLLAIAKYNDRYVVPAAHREQAHSLEEMACALDGDGGPGMSDLGPFSPTAGRPVPVTLESYQAAATRRESEGTS
jgi:nitrate reductase beta subunit